MAACSSQQFDTSVLYLKLYGEHTLVQLRDALNNPHDPQLNVAVRVTGLSLAGSLAWHLQPSYILGPSPDEFPSVGDWTSFCDGLKLWSKHQNFTELTEIIDRIVDKQESAFPWTLLMFHPKNWDLLVFSDLVSESTVNHYISTEWALLMAMPSDFCEIVNINALNYHRTKPIILPVLKLLEVMAEVSKPGGLQESSLLDALTQYIDSSDVEAEKFNKLISQLDPANMLPESWAKLLIITALFLSQPDPVLLTNLWLQVGSGRNLHLWLRTPIEQRNNHMLKVIEMLVRLEERDSLFLAAAIWFSCRDTDSSISKLLNESVVATLSGNELSEKNQTVLINCLLSTNPTLSEALLYSNKNWIIRISGLFPKHASRIAERIGILPLSLPREDYSTLRSSLEKIVSNRQFYPLNMYAAALNALISVDTTSRKPLTEIMWMSV